MKKNKLISLVSIILLFSNCRKDESLTQPTPIVQQDNFSANVFGVDSVFNGHATGEIIDGDLILACIINPNGSPYTVTRKIRLKLELEGEPFVLEKTYELYNDSAFYGSGSYSTNNNTGDAMTMHYYSTGYTQNNSTNQGHECKGNVIINSISSNKISGTFYFYAFEAQNNFHSSDCPGSLIKNGSFHDISIE
jgi:hypothetical protein